jgi:tripartite-type tricarboxylate transporter receptor subunit TctC
MTTMNSRVTRPRITWGLFAAGLLVATPQIATAQDSYPNRPIKVVLPYAAGGLVDVLARLVTEKVTITWGQPLIIEARPGASGNLGAEAVSRAEPDGYTLLVTPPPPLAINQHLYPKLGFEPAALVPATVIASAPNVLVVRPNLPVSSIQDLIAFAKTNPDQLSYASTGSGGTPHLTAEMFKAASGIRLVHVPYRGMPPAFVDLLAGHVDMMFANLGDSLPHIRSGRLKVLGVGSRTRLPVLPDTPAMSELLAGFVSDTWYAIVAPPKTPSEIPNKISSAVAQALKLPDVAKRLEELSVTPVGSSPAEAAEFIRQDSERWRQVIVSAAIKPE